MRGISVIIPRREEISNGLTGRCIIPYTVIMQHVFAQGVDIGQYAPGKSFTTIGSFVSVIVQNAFVLAGVIAFLLLVVGGFGMIASAGGDSKKAEQSKQAITAAVLGLVVIIGSFWIVQVLEKLTGLTLLPK
jgi:hypothetical protein